MSVKNNMATTTLALTVVASALALVIASDRVQAKPDSRREGRIAFTYGESGADHPAQLAVMDADGKHRRDVPTFYGVNGLSWSPDGRSIAAQSARDIYTVTADGRHSRRIVRNGNSPDWSPHGRAIAFERGGDIWVVDLKDHRQRRIVRHGDTPRWAPDGRKLAFARERGQICTDLGNCTPRTDIWLLDIAAKKQRLLARNGNSPNWSPDAKRIVFEKWRSSRGGDFDSAMYLLRTDGTGERRLFEGSQPTWSPNGQEIAFIGQDRRRHYQDAVIRARLDGSHRRVLYGSTPYCGCGSPDWAH